MNEEQSGIKLLVCGFEKTGKSVLTSKIEDAFIVSLDDKKYRIKVPHTNQTFETLDKFISNLGSALESYNDKYNKMPKVLVFDTVTQLYSSLTRYSSKFKGFDVHNNINKETLMFNKFIEEDVISKGIDVVIVAHTIFDKDTRRHVIPASGQFQKSGSWLSVVDQSIYLENVDNLRIVHFDSPNTPSRSILNDYTGKMNVDDFDINELIEKMRKQTNESDELEFS